MQDGLYAFINTNTQLVQTCRFPFGTSQCRRTLARLRRTDPPITKIYVPDLILIESIADEDRDIAWHFLVRATFFMLMSKTVQVVKATPYLMAFSTLAQVRFASIETEWNPDGLSILPVPIPETDFAKVTKLFRDMATLH
jgi:hypothetical protein